MRYLAWRLPLPIVYENNAFKYERETRERYFHHNLTIEKRNIE